MVTHAVATVIAMATPIPAEAPGERPRAVVTELVPLVVPLNACLVVAVVMLLVVVVDTDVLIEVVVALVVEADMVVVAAMVVVVDDEVGVAAMVVVVDEVVINLPSHMQEDCRSGGHPSWYSFQLPRGYSRSHAAHACLHTVATSAKSICATQTVLFVPLANRHSWWVHRQGEVTKIIVAKIMLRHRPVTCHHEASAPRRPNICGHQPTMRSNWCVRGSKKNNRAPFTVYLYKDSNK